MKLVTNYNEITRRANLYRLSLDTLKGLDDIYTKNILLSALGSPLEPLPNNPSVADTAPGIGSNLNKYFKTAIGRIHAFNDFLNQAETNIKLFNDQIEQFYIVNRKNIRETQRLFQLSQIKNRIFNSNSLVKNTFQDALKLHQGFLFDPKTNSALSSKDICNPSAESLTIQEISNYQIRSKYIYLDYSKTSGEIWGSTFDDVYNIYDQGKIFRCIMRKPRKDIFFNNEYLSKGANICLIFDFELKKYFNSLKISEASLKKLTIEKDDIEYLNSNGDWQSIDFNYDNLKDNYNVFFDTIYTDKIRITFKQRAFLDIENDIDEQSYLKSFHQTTESTLTETTYYYYDLSIGEISFEYSIYRNKGIYRSNELLSIYKPMSLRFVVEHLFKDPDVVTELYLRVMLYNDKDIVPKILDGVNEELRTSNPAVDEIIPVNSDFEYEDIIIPTRITSDSFESLLTFMPSKKSEITFEGITPDKVTFKLNNLEIDIDAINNYKSKQIKIVVNEPYDFTKKYSIKYRIKDNMNHFLGESCRYFNGQIVFNDKYQESIGFIQPIIIIRSKSKYNDSTNVISSYKLIVQEKEYTNKKNITFDIFLAENRGVV
jgi:hypothetical protein